MTRRNLWFAVSMAVLTLTGSLVAGGAAFWNYTNQLPSYDPPPVVLPVPNAFDDYVAAAAMCRAVGGSEWVLRQHRVPPRRLRAVVARNRAALTRLRQGFGRRYCAPPVVSFQQLFPELAGYRDLARVLVAEGQLAEREGRMGDAARSYRDCLRFGVDVPRGGTLIHGQVGISLQAIGLRALEESIHRFDGPTAANLVREMRALDQRAVTFAETLVGEKEGTTAALMEALRHGSVWEYVLQEEVSSSLYFRTLMDLRYGFPSKRALLATYRSYMDAGIADASKPYHATALPPWDGVVQFLAPDLGPTKAKWAVRDARWRIMELRFAAHAYQHRHSRPPPSAEALVPASLPAVPRDPFADRPLVYRLTANRALIYSRGPDGKDDGGQDLGESVYAGATGDIVTLKPRQPGQSGAPGTPPGGPPPYPTH